MSDPKLLTAEELAEALETVEEGCSNSDFANEGYGESRLSVKSIASHIESQVAKNKSLREELMRRGDAWQQIRQFTKAAGLTDWGGLYSWIIESKMWREDYEAQAARIAELERDARTNAQASVRTALANADRESALIDDICEKVTRFLREEYEPAEREALWRKVQEMVDADSFYGIQVCTDGRWAVEVPDEIESSVQHIRETPQAAVDAAYAAWERKSDG